jgi:hypothetical protein
MNFSRRLEVVLKRLAGIRHRHRQRPQIGKQRRPRAADLNLTLEHQPELLQGQFSHPQRKRIEQENRPGLEVSRVQLNDPELSKVEDTARNYWR